MQDWPESIREVVDRYAAGPQLLRQAVEGLTPEQVKTPAPPGRWSALEVVCHLADFETIYANRIKWALAEDNPLLPTGDEDRFAAALRYHDRDLAEELTLIELQRSQLLRILRTLRAADFERTGRHTVDGPIAVLDLLQRAARHLPHHVDFLQRKRPVLIEQAAEAS